MIVRQVAAYKWTVTRTERCTAPGVAMIDESLRRRRMFFVWTPQRIRIVIYFAAAYLALC